MAEDQHQQPFSFAQEVIKQLITLATTMVTLGIAFAAAFLGDEVPGSASLLAWSWLFLLVSIVCGVWALMALTGSLARTSPPDLYAASIRLPTLVQTATFLVGVAMTVWFGITVL